MRFLNLLALVLGLLSATFCAQAKNSINVDQELNRVGLLLKSYPEQARTALANLETHQAEFDANQLQDFRLLKASAMEFFNQQRESVEYINGFVDGVQDPDIKSKFLYLLSNSYVALGQYEQALDVMNASISLLPRLTDSLAKLDTLQSAINLYISLHAYDEALAYANRLYEMPVQNQDLSAKCIASSDRVEIYMKQNQRVAATAQMREAVELCDKNGRTYISLIVKALSAIDMLDHQEYDSGINVGLPLLATFPASMGIDYVSQLENGLALAYLKKGQLAEADKFGMRAYRDAESQKLTHETEISLETLVKIKRAQANYASAIEYAEAALKKKDALLDEQLQKNVAFQRVKFNMQDQSNQVTLLEKKNKILAIEKQLDKKNTQNLWLITALTMVLASVLGLYLWKVTLQKNFFRNKTQIDGLTLISNRGHFMTSAQDVVANRNGFVSLVLFDMDFFKRINDSFGHPVGDWVLSAVCQAVSAKMRPGDLFGRLGGEEFAICLPDTDDATAWQMAQRCRTAIASIDTEPSGFQIALTASFGVATYSHDDIGQYANLLVKADQALYRAKSQGRNCVSV